MFRRGLVLAVTITAALPASATAAATGGDPGRPVVEAASQATQDPDSNGPSPRVGRNLRLGNDKVPVRGPGVPALAVDPSNPQHIVEVDEDFVKGTCNFHVSFDGGATWSGGTLRAPAAFGTSPCKQFDIGGYAHMDQTVAFGSGQTVYTTFSAMREGADTTQSVLVAKSPDGGRTFQRAVVAIPAGTGGQDTFQRPKVAVQRSPEGDRIYVSAWAGVVLGNEQEFGASTSEIPGCGQPCGYRVVVAVSQDGGATWRTTPATAPTKPGEPADAAPMGIAREQSRPRVAPDGTVYVAWRSLVTADDPGTDYLVVGRSTDGGTTWQRSIVGGKAARLTHLRSPSLAVGPEGTVYVAYQVGPEEDREIRLQASTDGGTTWSPPTRVAAGTATMQVGVPQVAVAPSGRVDVVFYTAGTAYSEAATMGEVRYAYSTDGGKTFSPAHRVTDRSINFEGGLYGMVLTMFFYTPAITEIGDNRAMVAWPDSRLGNTTNGAQDIFLASIDQSPEGPTPTRRLAPDSATQAQGSVALSRLAYPGGTATVIKDEKPVRATKVVMVQQGDSAAALVGGVLARANLGPVLVAPSSGLDRPLREEIARLQPTGVYVVGGTTAFADAVESDLADLGVPSETIVRIAGAGPAGLAAEVAATLSSSATGDPAKTAVIANPAEPGAVAVSALAAALRLPILFVDESSVPRATKRALTSLGTEKTLLVGGGIGRAVENELPSPTRLGGPDPAATSRAVAAAHTRRGLPVNVVYVADPERPMTAAVAGAEVGRLGGLLLLADDPDAARAVLADLGLADETDRMVMVPAGDQGGLGALAVAGIAVGASLLVLGVVLLAVTFRRSSRRRAGAAKPAS